MSFGLAVTNDNDYLVIDSDTPRLCAIYSGTYAATSSQYATVTFPSPITTTEPPCIFLRNTPSRPGDLYKGFVLTGSANNWTGFRIEAANVTWRPAGKWFAAVFAAASQATWGLRLWAADGTVIYDSGTTPVIVTRANNSWSYVGTVSLSIGSAYYYRSNLVGALAEDEYFMANPFSRGLLAPGLQIWNDSGVRFNYTENRLQLYSIGTTGWVDIGDPASVFARLPGT